MKQPLYKKTLPEYSGLFKTGCLILDPAHGIDVAGKRSPDEKLLEYEWSRERIDGIIKLLSPNGGRNFMITSPFLTDIYEPGLLNRVKTYNKIADNYDFCLMLSLHNDAFKTPPAFWNGPGGFTFFTDQGEKISDNIVDVMGDVFQKSLPQENFRFDYALGPGEKIKDKDKEADFMVIHGYRSAGKFLPIHYAGILIENNFMDVQADLNKLLDPLWNHNLEIVYFNAIMRVFNLLGIVKL